MKKALLLLLTLALTPSLRSQEVNFWMELEADVLAPKLLEEMSVEEMVGQVLLFTYSGTKPDEEFISWVRSRGLGGVKIFGWNAANIPELVQSIGLLQKESQKTPLAIPLIVATDQEGGWVRHISTQTSQSSGNMSLGANRRARDAYLTGYYISQELRDLGINMNFAPTVDLSTNLEAHVIGPRAFTDDPLLTSKLATAFFRGSKDQGVITTAKHFPGHGEASGDSHNTLPKVNLGAGELKAREWIPYIILIQEGIPSIMAGHLNFPKLDPQGKPASLSKSILTGYLRETLGFQNVIVSDDLHMEGSRTFHPNIRVVCELALRAGSDLIMLSQTTEEQRLVYSHFIQKAKQDAEFLSILKDSVLRVLKLKLEYLKGDKAVPLVPEFPFKNGLIGSREGRDFFELQAFESVSALPGTTLPLKWEGKKILLVSPYNMLNQILFPNLGEMDLVEYDYFPFYEYEAGVLQQVLSLGKDYDQILFVLMTPGSGLLLSKLSQFSEKIFVLSLLSPIYLRKAPWVKEGIAVYGRTRKNFLAAAAVLTGQIPPLGTIPLQEYRP